MSSDKNTTEINLLDRKYLIACPQKEHADLLRAARYLNHRMLDIRRAGKVLSMERLSVMAALNITNEMLKREDVNQKNEAQISRLTEQLDQALKALGKLGIDIPISPPEAPAEAEAPQTTEATPIRSKPQPEIKPKPKLKSSLQTRKA